MTLESALRLMRETCTVSATSDTTLAQAVSRAQLDLATRAARGPQVTPTKQRITTAAGLDRDFEMRPVSAMLELSLGTALNVGPEVSSLARKWAILRHLGMYAHAANSSHLKLDEDAVRHIGPNQRRTLSEEIGIGFGIVAAKRWCRSRNPKIGHIDVIDFDVAINSALAANFDIGERQPDYILRYPDPDNRHEMVHELLETKGTVSAHNAVKQLGRASTQLASVMVDGNPVTGAAISTISDTDSVRILAVDPEEPPVRYSSAPEEIKDWLHQEPRKNTQSEPFVVSKEELSARSAGASLANVAAFAGSPKLAQKLLQPRKAETPDRDLPKDEMMIEGLTFLGSRLETAVPGERRRLTIFTGVESRIYRQLEGERAYSSDAQERFLHEYGQQLDDLADSSSSRGNVRASALASNGGLLSIEID